MVILSSRYLEEMHTDKIQEHESSYKKEGFLLKLLLSPPGTVEAERRTVSLMVNKRQKDHWIQKPIA